MASVRLDCTLCPKRPHFSDISHLLTHLASKGHLSHYFKAQVKSRQDTHIAHQLQAFDKWYRDNEMEQLLHERLMQKERKRPTARARQPAVKEEHITSRAEGIASSSRRSLIPQDSTWDTLDPRLTRGTASKRERHGLTDSQEQHTPYLRPSNLYPEAPSRATTPVPYPSNYVCNRYPLRNSIAGRLQKVRSYSEVAVDSSDSPDQSLDSRSRQSDTAGLKGESDAEAEPEINEYVTLKGIIWPGMDLFDSASPHAKRIRNQKKHHSCLEQMKKQAELIEPNEDIYYYPSWELKQSREITGQVESSSPEREEPPPPVQRQRGRGRRPRGRPPLMALDPNQPNHRRTRKRQIKDVEKVSESGISGDLPFHSLRSHRPGLPQSSGFWMTEQEESLDWSLTFDPYQRLNKKAPLQIYKDPVEHRTAGATRTVPSYTTEPRTPCPKPHRYSLKSQPEQSTLDPFVDAPSETAKQNLASRLDSGKENKAPNFDMYDAFMDPHDSNISLFPEPFPQRYFSMDSSTSTPRFSKTVPPFMDFLMGYPNMPMQGFSPFRGTSNDVNSILSAQNDDMQIQSAQPPLSPTSLNPLLEFSGILSHKIGRESDDETIDDEVEKHQETKEVDQSCK